MNRSTKPFELPEDVEARLRAFYRSEMPSPWPALSRTQPPRPPVSWVPAYASRLALAASVAILLAAGWYVAGSMAGSGPNFKVGPGDATRPTLGAPALPVPMNR